MNNIFNIYFFPVVMATIPTTSQITTSVDKDNRTDSNTDLSTIDTEDELHIDTSAWTPADKKKLQHMTEFHEEYQHVFGKGASIQTNYEKKNITYEPVHT